MLRMMMLLSRLPYWALHALGEVLAVLAHRVFGYRKAVIRGNITRSFPEASSREVRKIERLYYRHFGAITVESVKHFSVSEEEALGRMDYVQAEVFDAFHAAGRSVLIAGGHMNNWELYALTANQSVPHEVMAIYKKLSNEEMDVAMRASRERFGLKMVRTVDSKAWMESHMGDGHPPKAIVMGFDQSPADPKKSWWNLFLHQETAWYFGLEKWARDYDLPVVFGHIHKTGKGRYRTVYEVVTDAPRTLPEGAILERCIRLLEKDIERHPEQWLWSHKRWKHQRGDDQALHENVASSTSNPIQSTVHA
jgi:Kdo2-lipid IVA lauroyltransferase/acyltransferase